MSTENYDIIAAEVHRKALENLTNEMASTLVRTSGSPIVTDAMDFSTCLMDKKPEHLGFASYVMFHLGSSLVGTQVINDLVDFDDLRPGDGWIVNDPHTSGAMHQGDISVIMPTFHDDEFLGWSFANMHVLDIGGVGISGYAPGAHDVYQEGLLFPPVRIIRDGAIDNEWETFIGSNVRAPGPVLNDIRSMIAANNTATRKLSQIVNEFGLKSHEEFCEINKDLTEQVLRERISNIPDGVYETIDWNEFDGHDGPDQLLELKVRMEVSGSDLRFDYTGVPQIDAFVNSAPGAMMGQTMTGLVTVLGYGDLPINGGIWRPIEIDVGEEGTIVNSVSPAPVSNAHSEVGMRACKMTKDVLSQAMSLSEDPTLRSRVAGQSQDGWPGATLFGENQNGGVSVMFYVDTATGLGGGAQTIDDGQDCYGCTCMTGCGTADVEVHEAADPVLFLWRRLVPNSGGPGQSRGGQSLEQAYAIRYTDQLGGPGFNACAQVPPRGFGGGYPAATSNFYPIHDTNVASLLDAGKLPSEDAMEGDIQVVRSKVTHLVAKTNDIIVARAGGGAGLGDPLLRPAAKVLADIDDGYITTKHAAAAYGVVLDGDGGVDEAATESRRMDIRRERIGGDPAKDQGEPASMGVAVCREGSDWTCGYCSEKLGPADENWRSGNVVLQEYSIHERYEELEMLIRERKAEPAIAMREHFCASCAGSLMVDVATEGMDPFTAARSSEVAIAAGSVAAG